MREPACHDAWCVAIDRFGAWDVRALSDDDGSPSGRVAVSLVQRASSLPDNVGRKWGSHEYRDSVSATANRRGSRPRRGTGGIHSVRWTRIVRQPEPFFKV